MKYTSRADLLIAAGESIKMQEAAGIEPMCKAQDYDGKRHVYKIAKAIFSHDEGVKTCYEFPLAVIEGRPVFAGDELWNVPNNFKFKVEIVKKNHLDNEDFLCNSAMGGWISACSWNQPKPATVMVELLREDAKAIADLWAAWPGSDLAGRTVDALRKALESQK